MLKIDEIKPSKTRRPTWPVDELAPKRTQRGSRWHGSTLSTIEMIRCGRSIWFPAHPRLVPPIFRFDQALGTRATKADRFEKSDLPDELCLVAAAIESSRSILDLPLDPEEPEGELYSEEVWQRAVRFLSEHAMAIWRKQGHVIEAPNVLAGPDGSIDLHWENPRFELLINIPVDPNESAGFYGDDFGEVSIKGKIKPSAPNHGLMMWLE